MRKRISFLFFCFFQWKGTSRADEVGGKFYQTQVQSDENDGSYQSPVTHRVPHEKRPKHENQRPRKNERAVGYQFVKCFAARYEIRHDLYK